MKSDNPGSMRRAVFLVFLMTLHRHAIAGVHKKILIGDSMKIQVEEYCKRSAAVSTQAVIFLCGSGGLQSKNIPYRNEMPALSRKGYRVLVPHYLDVTRGEGNDPPRHYREWVNAVVETLDYFHIERAALVGYSLGASVALAAAQDPRVAAVIEFSGSLPDEYIQTLKALPPLLIFHGATDVVIPAWNARQLSELCQLKGSTCEMNIWRGEGHAFSAAAVVKSKSQMERFLMAHFPVAR